MYYFLMYVLVSGIIFTGILLKSMFKTQIRVSLLDVIGSIVAGIVVGWVLTPIYGMFQLDKIYIK